MTDFAQQTLAGIVTHDHRAATVLEKYHLDFCCKGKRTLAVACAEKGLSSAEIVTELESINGNADTRQMAFSEMTAEQLISHIENHHHFYVKETMPQISAHLERVAMKHGGSFPEMIEVFRLFVEISQEMTMHMHKEEMILFPAIKRAEMGVASNWIPRAEVSIIRGAINVMEMEHDSAGELLLKIQALTANYEPPIGACTTFRLSLAELKGFQEDLHRHVHLENNILFPMAKRFVNAEPI